MRSLDFVTNGTSGGTRTGKAPVHPFDADTAVRQIADGRFAAEVTGRWTTPIGTPNGLLCTGGHTMTRRALGVVRLSE